jgi:hypothetical protein
MLLKVIEDGIKTSFEIDTAREADGKRWVQLWGNDREGKYVCLKHSRTVDEAVDEAEARFEIIKKQ